MAKKQAVLFDLGNVLVFFSFPKMFAQMAECTGLSASKLKEHFFDTSLRVKYESGKLSTDALYEAFLQASPKRFSKDALLTAISDIFVPNEPLFPLVHALKEKGHRLVLLSNTSEAHFSFLLPRTPVLSLFDAHVLSYEVGSMKPDAPIYEAAVEAAGHPPQKCFYTDDIVEFVEGGKMLGIDGELFTGVEALEKQLRMRDLL